jgi:hypothetical protein
MEVVPTVDNPDQLVRVYRCETDRTLMLSLIAFFIGFELA